MWKSVISRITQSRNLVTTSRNFAYNKGGGPFSDNGYIKKNKERYGQGGDFEFASKENFRERQYVKKSYDRRESEESEGRHYSFDSARQDYPEKSYKRFQRNEDHGGRSSHQERGEEFNNANLVEIGIPGKWKVGAGFVKEANRLRDKAKKYSDFKKIDKPAKFNIQDPGIRRQAKVLEPFIEPNRMAQEEELDNELDVSKFDQVYETTRKDKNAIKELVKMKMVKEKYFKEPKESVLSWSDKEHIRYLHNTDPQQWTFEMIADHFKIDPQVAKAVATAKWIPKKPKTTELISADHEEEVYPLAKTTEDHQIQEQESFDSKKMMTWQELRVNMGEADDRISTVKKPEASPPVIPETSNNNDQDLILGYLTHESPSKWASDKSTQPELKVEQNEKSTVVYYYDNKHGYQHPLGKMKDEKLADTSEAVKNGELYQKGDAFYSSDGELLYRVPGLMK